MVNHLADFPIDPNQRLVKDDKVDRRHNQFGHQSVTTKSNSTLHKNNQLDPEVLALKKEATSSAVMQTPLELVTTGINLLYATGRVEKK